MTNVPGSDGAAISWIDILSSNSLQPAKHRLIMPAGSKEELDKLAGDYKSIAEKYGTGLQGKTAVVTGSNTGKQVLRKNFPLSRSITERCYCENLVTRCLACVGTTVLWAESQSLLIIFRAIILCTQLLNTKAWRIRGKKGRVSPTAWRRLEKTLHEPYGSRLSGKPDPLHFAFEVKALLL